MSIFGGKGKEKGAHNHSVVIWGNAYRPSQETLSQEQPSGVPSGPHAAAVDHEMALRDSVRQREESIAAHPSRPRHGSIRLR